MNVSATPASTVILGEGYAEVDLPIPSTDPAAYVWTDIVALFWRDDREGRTVQFPADLAGQVGTLVAITGAPRELGEIDLKIRQHARIYPAGLEIELGHGPVRLRARTIGAQAGTSASPHHERTGIGVGDEQGLDGAAVRAIANQWVTLEFRPDVACQGFATCSQMVPAGQDFCGLCIEDGWGNECANCGAPGGRGEHGYCGSCHAAGLCHVCDPED